MLKWRLTVLLLFSAVSSWEVKAEEPNETFATATVLAPGVLSVNDFLFPGTLNFPDTLLGIRDVFGSIYHVDDNGSPLGDGFASSVGGVSTNSGSIDFAITGLGDDFFSGSHVEFGEYEVFVDVYDFFDDPIDSLSEVRTLEPGIVHEFSFNDFEWIGGSYDVYIDNTIGPASGGDVDFFTFTGLTPGASFTAETINVNPNAIDTLLGWFDSAGGVLALDDDGGEGNLSKLAGSVPENGALTFVVTGYGDDAFVGTHDQDGIYELRITLDGQGPLGDYNSDGIVDAADYTVWRDGLDGPYTPAHYETWKQNFGAPGGAGLATSTVPEPAGVPWLAAAAATLIPLLRLRGEGLGEGDSEPVE